MGGRGECLLTICNLANINLLFTQRFPWFKASAPVPVIDLLHLVDLSKVRWDLAKDLISTWAGMVFVVSFSSCLDVAAISMDTGEALDVNAELTTVGIANCKRSRAFMQHFRKCVLTFSC